MLGKTMDGQKLLALFALLMLVVAGMMFRSRGSEGDPAVVLNRGNAPKMQGSGAVTGLLSGFIGVGGGGLGVPGDRKSVVEGKEVVIRRDRGGWRVMKRKKKTTLKHEINR